MTRFTKSVAYEAFNELNKIANEVLDENHISEDQLIKGLYYQNANDGSLFDWFMNNRTCEFYRFYKRNSEGNNMGAVKLYVTESGTIAGYVFPSKDTWEGTELTHRQTEIDGFKFAKWLDKNRDEKGIWNEPVPINQEG